MEAALICHLLEDKSYAGLTLSDEAGSHLRGVCETEHVLQAASQDSRRV